jgi:small subunit ribosomal protein S16
MVVLRLARAGSKKRPFYHIVAADRRDARDGRFIEKLGFYNPVAKSNTPTYRLDLEKAKQWVQNGAKPSDTVARIIGLVEKNGNPEQAVKEAA